MKNSTGTHDLFQKANKLYLAGSYRDAIEV